MKKAVVSILTVALLVSLVFSQAAFAATKADILTESRKSPIFHYIEGEIIKLMAQVDPTSEQCEQVIEVVKRVNGVVTEDKGSSYIASDGTANYTVAEKEAVEAGIADICAILGVAVEYTTDTTGTSSQTGVHEGDIIIKFYDQNGDLISSINPDEIDNPIRRTDTASETSYVLVAVSAVLVVVAAVAFVYGKKKIESK